MAAPSPHQSQHPNCPTISRTKHRSASTSSRRSCQPTLGHETNPHIIHFSPIDRLPPSVAHFASSQKPTSSSSSPIASHIALPSDHAGSFETAGPPRPGRAPIPHLGATHGRLGGAAAQEAHGRLPWRVSFPIPIPPPLSLPPRRCRLAGNRWQMETMLRDLLTLSGPHTTGSSASSSAPSCPAPPSTRTSSASTRRPTTS